MESDKVLWIETFTGKRVNPLHLTPEDIDIQDIAHSLSLLCRYTGHCSRFYSVGQHSLHVAYVVSTHLYKDEDTKNRTCLAALLHDAAEAYLGDMSSPVKSSLKEYKEIEARALGVIMGKYVRGGYEAEYVRKADEAMLATEAKYLMSSKGEGWKLVEEPLPHSIPEKTPSQVEELFMVEFRKYSK